MKPSVLEKIKLNLLKEAENIKQHISTLSGDDPLNDPTHASDNAAVDLDVREQDTHQRIEAELLTLTRKLSDIQNALHRIDKGSYGLCKRCNKEIPDKRLELIPETIYCVQCEGQLKR